MDPFRILGLASQIATNDNLLRMPRHSNSVLVRKTCPPPSAVMSTSIKQYFIGARSVGPFGPPEEQKGVQHMFFLFLENCFSRAAWNLFDVGDQSVPTHLASNIPFGSFQCSFSALWRGVKRRPHRGGSQSSQEAEVTAVHRLTTPLPSFSLADTKRIGFSVEHSALHP